MFEGKALSRRDFLKTTAGGLAVVAIGRVPTLAGEKEKSSDSLINQIDSAKMSRNTYFDYTESMDEAYRNEALSAGKQIGFGVPPSKNTREPFIYAKGLDRKCYDNPDPSAQAV